MSDESIKASWLVWDMIRDYPWVNLIILELIMRIHDVIIITAIWMMLGQTAHRAMDIPRHYGGFALYSRWMMV